MYDPIDFVFETEWFYQTSSDPQGSLKVKDVLSMKPNIDLINKKLHKNPSRAHLLSKY